jgi:hypothetical protein
VRRALGQLQVKSEIFRPRVGWKVNHPFWSR